MIILEKRTKLLNLNIYNLSVMLNKCKLMLNKVRLLKISQKNRIKSNQGWLLLKINFKNRKENNLSKFLKMKNYKKMIFLMKMK